MTIRYNTIGMDGVLSGSQLERKKQRKDQELAKLPDDLEIERDILEARANKKAMEDAGRDMLLDEIKRKTKPRKGRP